MPLYVLEMSTDADIVATNLANAWPAVTGRSNWAAVQAGGINIPAGADIVVIAHGTNDNNYIGNGNDNNVHVDADAFLVLIQTNMAGGVAGGNAPANIYISTCGNQVAGFAGNVAIGAGQNNIWAATTIYGHNVAVAGDVPTPGVAWTNVYVH